MYVFSDMPPRTRAVPIAFAPQIAGDASGPGLRRPAKHRPTDAVLGPVSCCEMGLPGEENGENCASNCIQTCTWPGGCGDKDRLDEEIPTRRHWNGAFTHPSRSLSIPPTTATALSTRVPPVAASTARSDHGLMNRIMAP